MSASVEAAARLIADLVGVGVRDVVLSPGSRSAPIAYVLAAAEREDRLRLHVRHDERSAGFLGLGIGRADPDHPAVVVTTSGSAVANLVPAAMEAHHGGVPLLLLTADRPLRLRGTWANQTSTSQGKLLASIAHCVDIDPVTCEGMPWVDALETTKGGGGRRPGPAHLNVCFDVPLQPPPGHMVSLGSAFFQDSTSSSISSQAAQLGSAELALGPRTVVVAGDGAGPQASALAQQARWPLLAEPTSGARFSAARIDAYRLILPALAERVERVVVYGRPTLSRPVTSLLDDPRVQVIQVVRHGDDLGPGRKVVRVGGVTVAGADDPGWLYEWAEAGLSRSMAAYDTIEAWPVATGLKVARLIAAVTTPKSALFVGSSNAVRDLDLVAAELPSDALIVANRGLAGIDGAVSTAVGVAIASGRPTRAYLGDLTMLHDLNGLAIPAIERDRIRLQIVVANDDGGGIFSTLEHANHPEAFERVFATPVGPDLASLCAGYGVGHRKVRLDDLGEALTNIGQGISVVEVATSRANLARLHAAL